MGKRFEIDQNAWEILQEVKKMMKEEGIAGPSHSDCIRWLYERFRTMTLHKKKYQSFSDIVDHTISGVLKQQLEICVREYRDPADKDFYGFFMVGEGEGLFSPRFYRKEEMVKDLTKWVNELIK